MIFLVICGLASVYFSFLSYSLDNKNLAKSLILGKFYTFPETGVGRSIEKIMKVFGEATDLKVDYCKSAPKKFCPEALILPDSSFCSTNLFLIFLAAEKTFFAINYKKDFAHKFMHRCVYLLQNYKIWLAILLTVLLIVFRVDWFLWLYAPILLIQISSRFMLDAESTILAEHFLLSETTKIDPECGEIIKDFSRKSMMINFTEFLSDFSALLIIFSLPLLSPL